MSYAYKLPFTRHGMRGVSDLTSCTAMEAMTTLAFERMVASGWTPLDEADSDLPPHQYSQSGFKDGYDAAKFCGDYAAGKQRAYASAVCYTIRIPADARAGTVAKMLGVSATLYGDRWTECGAVLAAIPSASAKPPDWAGVLAAVHASPDPVTVVDDPDPTWQAPLRRRVRANAGADPSCEAALALGAGVDATAYLHVVLRLGDYIAAHGAWIEGGAMLDGTTLTVAFDRAVAADAQARMTLLNEFDFDDVGRNDNRLGGTIDNQIAVTLKYVQTDGIKPVQETGDAAMMRRLLEMRECQTIAQLSSIGGYAADNRVIRNFSAFTTNLGCRYENVVGPPAFHQYWLSGLFMARSTCTNGETADGLSFDVAIPTLPTGQRVRIAMYVHEGPLPYALVSDGDRIACNIVTMASACDPAVILGTATSVSLAYWMESFQLVRDDVLPYPPQSATVVSVGVYDLPGGGGLAAHAKVPFSAPFALPRFCVVFVAINVVGYTAEWVAAPGVSTAVQFKPSELFLHLV